jgi:arylsulfatase B
MTSFLHTTRLVSILCLLSYHDYYCCKAHVHVPRRKPHVLFILADDIGWGDVGFNLDVANKEIQTPNLDDLALNHGIHLLRHYVHMTCTGTRTAVQSGRLPVHVQTSLKNPEEPDSGMPRNMTGLAEQLRQQFGYRTHHVGKWDIGLATPKHIPLGRGYER